MTSISRVRGGGAQLGERVVNGFVNETRRNWRDRIEGAAQIGRITACDLCV